MVYRSDIDGLRAVAVLAVVMFHIGIDSLAGGFVGVDVFFVISGFLITSTIRSRAEAGTFGFLNFYINRIRRLVPALIAMVVATFLTSLAILTPDDMMAFARTTVAALFSASNIVFFLEAGYWDTLSETKPLLHTWSLGVEEQFYFFWPMLVIALVSIQRRISFGASMALITVVGMGVSQWFSAIDSSAVFYLFPFRIFQFSAGALTASIANSPRLRSALGRSAPRDLMFVAGMMILAASILALGSDGSVPDWFSLPPTLGTVLILLSGASAGQGPIGHAVLSNPAAVWIGRVSYSMYLVNWPIVSLYRYEYGLALHWVEQVGLGVSTLLATALLHYGVERRYYRRSSDRSRSISGASNGRFALRSLATAAFVSVFAVHAWTGDGWSWRYTRLEVTPEEIKTGERARVESYRKSCFLTRLDDRSRCFMDRPHQLLFFGDSHEPDGFNIMTPVLRGRDDINVIVFGTTNQCGELSRTDAGWVSEKEKCDARLHTLQSDAFIESLDTIVYAAKGPFKKTSLSYFGLLQDLKTKNSRLSIITIGGYLSTSTPCARLINESGFTSECRSADYVSDFPNHPETDALYSEIMGLTDVFIDRIELLCSARELQTCLTQTPSGVPMFHDRHHNLLEFARFTGAELMRQQPGLLNGLMSVDQSPGGHGSN